MRHLSKRSTLIGCLLGLCSLSFANDAALLRPGSVAPDFTLPSSSGESISLRSYRGVSYVVLILYPGDATPVCTQQLCAIRDEYAQFREANAVVFGINSGGANSHQQFALKHQFSFPLLIDKGNIVTKRYGAKGLLAAKRTVYVVGLDGTIIFAQRGKPDNATILKAIPAK